MKKIISFLLLTLQVTCLAAEESQPVSIEAEKLVLDSNEFALQLYGRMDHKGNLCLSPYSISSAFAMAYTGTKGQTQNEMSSVFHFPSSIEETDQGWLWLNKFITHYPSNSSDDLRVKVGNSLWVQTNFQILPSYKEAMTKYFNGEFRFVDFEYQADTAVATINDWVKESTFGKITDILNKNSVDSNTRMVLVSALYFKAKWLKPFDARITNQQPFFINGNEVKTVAMMHDSERFPYLETADASFLSLPYSLSRENGPEYALLLGLPHDRKGLPALEKELTATKVQDWISQLKPYKVIISLPKFKIIKFTNLNVVLKAMGLNTAFSDSADFSGMTGEKSLKISQVLHKVYLSVDEAGTEAAAATAITMNLTSVAEQNQPVYFKADHPFIYMIYEKKTGAILFMGRVNDPSE